MKEVGSFDPVERSILSILGTVERLAERTDDEEASVMMEDDMAISISDEVQSVGSQD